MSGLVDEIYRSIRVAGAFGGDGSGPRPGYKRSRKGVTIPTHAVAPDGTSADNGQFGRAFETIMLDRVANKIAKDLKVGKAQRISSNDGGSTTTPIDIVLGDMSQPGKHYAGEVKSQHVEKSEYKVSVSAEAMARKLAAAKETGAVPLTILQVIDQDKREVSVHVMTDQFTSFRAGKPGGTNNRVADYKYKYTEEQYRKAYEDAGG